MNNPVFIILGILVLALILGIIFKKKKGSDTPESLEKYFRMFVETMEKMPPFLIIFKKYSNDGNQIVYKEITNSRDCFIKFERYRIIIDCYNKNGEQIFYDEEKGGVYGGMPSLKLIEKLHYLYVNRLSNRNISI